MRVEVEACITPIEHLGKEIQVGDSTRLILRKHWPHSKDRVIVVWPNGEQMEVQTEDLYEAIKAVSP